MKIKLSDHFTYKKLLQFTLPSIVMMIFTSIYGVVDGFFVSNYVGKTEFAAVNFIMPFLMILGTVGFMFGTGGSALVSKTFGEGDKEKANKIFSMLIYSAIILGFLLMILGLVFIRPVASLLGAKNQMLENCVTYGSIILFSLPSYILQYAFQSFFITAEKPQLGLIVTLIAGFTNIICDALFVAVFKWGLIGAAVATALSQVFGGIIPLFYFLFPNKSLLRLKKTNFDFGILFKASSNGFSELLSNVSSSIVGMLYNMQLMKYAGENGVASYGVLMYVNLVFIAIFIGYSIGTAPIIGYNYGADNTSELKCLFKKSLIIIGTVSILMFISGEVFSKTFADIFVGYDDSLLGLTLRAFHIFSFSFLFSGIAIFGSSFFTALNNGLISALISFFRTLVFQIAAVLILPLIFGIDGIWFSIIVAEFMAALVSTIFLIVYKNKYNY